MLKIVQKCDLKTKETVRIQIFDKSTTCYNNKPKTKSYFKEKK